jgi:hypothetical protein
MIPLCSRFDSVLFTPKMSAGLRGCRSSYLQYEPANSDQKANGEEDGQ